MTPSLNSENARFCGQLINLTPIVGGSRVTAINSKGVLGGYGSNDGRIELHAFIWRDGEAVDLGALDAQISGATASPLPSIVKGKSSANRGMLFCGKKDK